MVWAVATVTLLLLAAASLLAAVVIDARREFDRLPGRFDCRLRLAHGALPGLGRQWKGRALRAAWAHDVLLVRRGSWRTAIRVLHVRSVEGAMREVSPGLVRGLGPAPVLVRLRLDDDGDVVEAAAPAIERELLVGPFLAACVDDEDQPRRHPRQSRVDPD